MATKTDSLLTFAYIILFAFWGLSYYVVIPVPLNLIVTSTAIVFIGSHRSLNLLVSEEDGGPVKEEKEVLTANDAYKFPLVGSASLFGLYLAFKYLDKDTVNLVLSLYFSVVGVATLTGSLSKFVSQFITSPTKYGTKFSLPWLGEIDLRFTSAELVCLALSIVFSYYYFQTKHYMLNNIFGISFCIQALERMSLGSFKVGAILLVGLFFYDIFWVFGTDVMVTVAKSFDGPIKLLFPRVLPGVEVKGEFSLLGLGDIVIPGLFVALLLRFDAVRANIPLKALHSQSFAKPFFLANVVAYATGLLVTVLIMFFFQAAQPALLYLVPACLGAALAVGMARSELGFLLGYDEEKKDTIATATAVPETEAKKQQ